MKPYILLSTLMLAMCISQYAIAQPDTITIIHINDSHSALAPAGPRDEALRGQSGGIARAASMIGYIKQTEPNVLTLHAGDFAIGDIFYNTFFGVPELRILSMLGLDAMTIGNHEFDLTPSTLQMSFDTAFAGAAPFPILSANCVMEDSTVFGLKNYIQPYTIKTFGNTSVGIFGLTTPETNLLSQPAPVFIDTNILEIASQTIAELKSKGCNVIILLSHLGYTLDSIVATNVPGIDVIVGGHDHYLFAAPHQVQSVAKNLVPIVQAGSHYSHVGKLQLIRDGSTVSLTGYQLIELDSSVPQEPNIQAAVDGLIAEIELTYGAVFTQRIGTATNDLEEVSENLMSSGPHDTPVGNLCADAFHAAGGSNIAIQVGGSTAQKLLKGPIVGDDIFRMVGYGFNTDNGLGYRLATFTMTGAALAAGLEFGLSDIEHNDELLVQTSGMRYTYDPLQPAFGRVTGVEINGEALDTGKVYSVTANEFAALVLSTIGLPIADLHIYSDTTEFQVVTAYVMALGTISPIVEGRISSVTLSVEKKPTSASQRFLNFAIRPNPCHVTAKIYFPSIVDGMVSVTIIDTRGQILLETTLPTSSASLDLPIHTLSEGVYLCKAAYQGKVGLKLLQVTK